MFSFYGSKSKLLKHYPPPKYGRIIEPFAGSARYSLKYPENDVLLVDADPCIARIWEWLIREATEKDIKSLPDLKRGDDLREIKFLSDVERDFLGFAVNRGVPYPRNIMTKWPSQGVGEINRLKQRAIENLSKIRHWKCVNTTYIKIKMNPKSTWFIDPPYATKAGRAYIYNKINYNNLASWCRQRSGLTIVCEQQGSNWLPFNPIEISLRGQRRTLTEAVWISDN